MKYTTVKPIIKWAGGKSQLLDVIRTKYPQKITRYCEPFVGGGAVLLDILANFQPKEVLINDINPQLTNLYAQIRDNVEYLIKNLASLQETYWKMDTEERKDFYLKQRERFNCGINNEEISNQEMAYLFIFLNKTCFNGLYRVNRKGLFNVPIGSYKKPPICDAVNLRKISVFLQGVEIMCGDYSQTADFIDDNTFVYIDPPYRPLTETASFTSYANTVFGDKEQKGLARFVTMITEKGAKVVASNSDPKNVNENDEFFDLLYCQFIIDRVYATRAISCKGTGRKKISELLISNFNGGTQMKTLTVDDERTMELICKLYGYMDKNDKENWSFENAEDMVHDQIMYDKEHGIEPMEYDVFDFYDTIKALIEIDEDMD